MLNSNFDVLIKKSPGNRMIFFNTLTRKKEEFFPIREGVVGIYSCGPTVYDFVHLGNLRAYVFVDLLKRYLRFRGFVVNHIINVTDIDDKTIRESRKVGRNLKEYTEVYFDEFKKDLQKLNILFPERFVKATNHIEDMVSLVVKLKRLGYAYESNGSTYFRIDKVPSYGNLALLSRQSLKRKVETKLSDDEYSKDEVDDFVLWKAWKPDDGENYWETELGKGRPGWHIECSAMSMRYLGESFDIHTGGIDLIFPHHTNEIAQSESATGKKFVNFWLHNDHLLVNGEKMSKSLGNFYTLRDDEVEKFDPLLVRMSLLKSHYRQSVNFTEDLIGESAGIINRIINSIIDLSHVEGVTENDVNVGTIIEENRRQLISAMDDDLNIGRFFTFFIAFIGDVNKLRAKLNVRQASEIMAYIFEIDSIVGVFSDLYRRYQMELENLVRDKEINRLLKKREESKERRDFKTADWLREEILNLGLQVIDSKSGYYVKLSKFL